MIQKNLYWENFLKMFQNGPIRKVITKKVIFEDFLIFSPAVGHPGSTLRKILEDFFKKSQVRNSHYLFCYILGAFLVLVLNCTLVVGNKLERLRGCLNL